MVIMEENDKKTWISGCMVGKCERNFFPFHCDNCDYYDLCFRIYFGDLGV